MMGRPSAKRAHTNPSAFGRLFEGRRPATIRSADQKVGTKADGGKQSDAEHHLLMAAHSLLGPTDRQRAHDRHGVPSMLQGVQNDTPVVRTSQRGGRLRRVRPAPLDSSVRGRLRCRRRWGWGRSFASRPHGATLPGSARWNAFGNSLADSVSFRFPPRRSLDRSPRLRSSRSRPTPPSRWKIQDIPLCRS